MNMELAIYYTTMKRKVLINNMFYFKVLLVVDITMKQGQQQMPFVFLITQILRKQQPRKQL